MALEELSWLVQNDMTTPVLDFVSLPSIVHFSDTPSQPKATAAMRIQLPTDFPRTPDLINAAAIHSFELPMLNLPNVCGENALSQSRSLLLSALIILLYRYTQQKEIPLAVIFPSALSHCGSPFELCTDISGDLTLKALIDRVNPQLQMIDYACKGSLEQQFNQIAGHQDQSIRPTLASGGLPIAVTWVETVESADSPLKTPSSEPVALLHDYELHLYLHLQANHCSATLTYNAKLFSADTIQRLSRHLQVLLAAMVDTTGDITDLPIARLPLLTLGEIRQQLVDWQSDTVAYPDMPLHHYIENHAIAQPDEIAATFQSETLTYGVLNERANQLAHELQRRGVQAEIPVAVCVSPSLDILVCLLGVLKAGGVYVPLDPTHPIERLAVMLADTQPQVLLTQSDLLGNLPVTSIPQFCLDRDWESIATLPITNLNAEISLSQTASIIYTSGTTGKPKGVMASQQNLMNYVLLARDRYGISAQDVMASIARFTFSITMFELLLPLVAGGKLVILERDHVLDFKRLLPTVEQLTVLHISPSLMRKLLGYIQDQKLDLRRFQGLRHVSVGGDLADAELLDRMKTIFSSAEIFVIYGCSEVSCMGCTYPVLRSDKPTQSRVGQPFNNVIVRLYDADHNLVPVGVVGEIYFGGAGVTKGYLNRPDLTHEKFVEIDGQRFYCTGDLGRFDRDGNLEILGRSDFQIKLRGIRIELGDIETTLRQAPGVRDGVVMARQLGASEKSLVAYVVLEQTQEPAIAEIRHFLQTKLPDYMVPAAFIVLEALPVNINQKVDRRALPEPTPENLAGFKPFISPRNEVEQELTKIWETVLGISPIGVEDDFFEVGGHSLLALALMMQVETVFGKTLPLSTLLTEPTIAQMAALLNPPTGESGVRNSLVLLKEGGSKPPIFFIHDGEGETLLYRTMAYYLKPEHPVYGIQPYSRGDFPMLHTRITEMAAYYIELIRQVQPQGPYLLGGLCVGGFLAFEMARQLQNQGQVTALIALIDTADVEAPLRSIAAKRLSSFSKSFSQGCQRLSPVQRIFAVAKKAGRKIRNTLVYELETTVKKAKIKVKMKLFRYYLDHKLTVPHFLHNIPVRIALKFAEREYIPQAPYRGEVVLFRATQASNIFDGTPIDDTPYQEIYSDPLLGWKNRATAGVRVYDIPGGHSSMLQEPNVQVMAEAMQAYIDRAIENGDRP